MGKVCVWGGGGGGGCLICFRHRGKSGSRRKEGSVLFNDTLNSFYLQF